MDILSLGEKIKRLRKEKNMTLKELAGDRITAAQISHIERDKSHTSHELLEYLSDKLNVSIDYLLESKEMQSKKITDSLILQSELFIKCDELDKAINQLSEVRSICEKYHVNENFGKCDYLLGIINLKQEKYNDAVNSFEKALYFFIKNNDEESIYNCYLNIGDIYIKEGFYKGAISRFDLAEDILKKINMDSSNIYKNLYSKKAHCYTQINDTGKCLEYIKKIDEICKKNNPMDEVEIISLKANNLFGMGRYEESKDYFKKALKVLEKEENKTKTASVYLTISDIYNKLGDKDKVLEYSSLVYDIKKESEDEYMMNALFKMIDVYVKNNEFEIARRYCKIALASSIKYKNKFNEYKVLRFYADMYKVLNQREVSIEYLNKCIKIMDQEGNKQILASLYFELGELYSNVSKEKELENYQKGASMYKNIDII